MGTGIGEPVAPSSWRVTAAVGMRGQLAGRHGRLAMAPLNSALNRVALSLSATHQMPMK